MANMKLLDFQQCAANKLIENAVAYFEGGQDRIGGRPVPYVGQLKAVTGAGKTPILSEVAGKLSPSIILWTTKFGSVVDQTASNLGVGGKYHHLLGPNVQVIRFSEIPSAVEWDWILESKTGVTILVSTVAAWNSAEKDERLNVHRVHADWGPKSRWERLKMDRKRPLWVVYDEAHNTTTEQIEQLDDLEPAGFFVASASPVGGKLQLYLTNLPEDVRNKRIVPVSTRAVVEAELLKSIISLADYQSSDDEMIQDAAKKRQALEGKFKDAGVAVTPKAIYVVETSASAKGAEPRPVSIWKALTKAGIDPATIAICTNTPQKELPKGALKVHTIDQLSDNFTHIIFNKKLQEGWDDPSVYVCYFDGKTESATRIQQVIGRALRQPMAKHLGDEDLNTAYFYIHCPNETLEKITDQLKEELRIYKSDDDEPEFEPFRFKEERKALPPLPLRDKWVGKLKVPRLQPELPEGDPLGKIVEGGTFNFDDADRAAPGKALVNIVSVKTGDVTQDTRNLLEDMRVRCGTYLQEQIRSQSKNCANSMHPSTFSNAKLDKSACYKSKALEHYKQLSGKVVAEYENRVRLDQLADPAEAEYVIGPHFPTGTVKKEFKHSAHTHYDTKAFNEPELEMAKALDKFDHAWVRNKDRVGYGIPLPVKSGSSSTFYPDFLWWVKKTVWGLDPTGKFILLEKIRTKLLTVPPPLKIALMTPDKYDQYYKKIEEGGWTLVRFRVGNVLPETFDSLDLLLAQLVAES
jgi:type III restriction enzyme